LKTSHILQIYRPGLLNFIRLSSPNIYDIHIEYEIFIGRHYFSFLNLTLQP